MNNMKTLLDVEIEDLFDQLAKMEDKGSKEYAEVEKHLTELTNVRLEIARMESSESQNEKKMKEDRKDRVGRFVGDIVKTLVPLGTSVVMSFLLINAEAKGVTPFGVGKKWLDKITKY